MAVRASNVITAFLVLQLVAVASTYCLAVSFKHVSPLLPQLGFLGDRPLESTVFTQLFAVVASALIMVIQVHYVSVSSMLEKNEGAPGRLLANTAGVYVGYLAALGLFILSCFQENHAYYVHHIGEVVYLACSVAYCGLHAFICMKTRGNTRSRFRVILTTIGVAAFCLFLVSYAMSVRRFDREWSERYYWKAGDGGWIPHVMSCGSEWTIIATFQAFMMTCYPDVRQTLITKTSIIAFDEFGR